MRTYFIRSLIILLIAGLGLESVKAQSTDQNYPVSASAFVAAQPNQNLSAYFSSSQALSVTLLLKDLTKPSLQVYLKWSIEGPGVRVASMEGYIPPGLLLLDMGVLRRFSGLELQSDYFRNNVIEEQGLGGSALRTNLPEGFYTFRVQAMEAGTGRQVSNIAETYFSITTPLPPVINLPFNGAVLRQAQDDGSVTLSLSKSPQIQWMPRHYKQAGNTTTYDLKVCKVPDGYEPQEALDACVNPIIDDKANPGTFYPSNTGIGNSIIGAFDPSTPLGMTIGARYAVRVTVHEFDANGDEVVFANEGRSEVVWFRYGSPCISPENFTIKEIGSGRVQLSWADQTDTKEFKIHYRKTGAASWTTQNVTGISTTVSGLSQGTYEFAVQSSCTDVFPRTDVPANIQAFELSDDEDEDLPPALANPLQILVQASGCNALAPGNLADYYTNFPGVATPGVASNPTGTTRKLKIPACALQSSAFSVCSPEHPVIPLPTGGTPLGALKAGDVLGIYDFAVFVTEAFGSSGGFSGKGLVRLPFLEGTLALAEFSGVKAWSAEGEGGCIYEVSNFRLLNVSQAEVAAAKGKLISTLAGQNDPAAFAGTLADALAAYDSLSKTAPADSICPFKTAIIDASDQISDELTDLDTDHPGITAILNDLKAITDSLRAGAVVDDITKKYEDIVARLDSLKALDPDNDQPILAIRNAQISNLTGQSARISWEPSGEFSRYVIEYRDPNGGTLQETVTSPQVNLQRLLPGTQYTYRILGYQDDQVVASYGEDVFTTVRKVVPVPENLAYTALNMDGVKLTWDKNRDHQSYKIIYVDQFGQERSIYPTTNSARIDGLARDQKYTYRILAVGDGGVESEVVNNQFKIGLVCDMLASAAQPRIIQGEQVALWLTGCVDEDNSEGPVQWTDGKNVFIGNTVFVSPAASTTYTGTCLLNRTSANGEMQSIACSDAKVTVIVDKKCEGVAVSATPITIVQGEPVMLRETGCTGDVQWIDGYPAGQLVGLKSNTIINPLEDKTYTLSCTDKENNHCYVKTGKIEVKCALKLAVNYNQPYVNYKWYQPGEGQDPTEPGDQAANWFEYLSYAGLGIENVLAFNLLKWVFAGTLKKQASIQAIGCPVPVTWEYHHASANNDLSSRNFLYLEKIKNKTWAKATCVVGGKVCTAEAQLDKPDKDCKDFRITLEGDPAKNNVLILKVNSKKDIAWEDGSTNKERIVAIPQKSTVYTVVTTRGACKESIGIDVPLVKPPINIPCPDLTLTKLSGSEKIAAGSSLTKIKFKASGCTDGVDSYPIVWRKNGVVEETPLISADITGEVKELTFTDNDVKKQFTITVECAITTRSASTTFVITKGAATPQPPKPQPENKPHPCDFLLSTSEYQFGNTFQQSQPVKIIVESAQPNLNVMYEQDYNKIIIGGASTTYSNGVATIQFNHDPAKRGAFFVKVTNTVPGASFCTKGIYIFVDNNRSYTADDGTYQPDPKLVGTTSNCEKYRGGAEIPIVKNTTGTSIRILNNQNDLLDFGAISLFVNGQTVFYPDVTLPDKLALVDKVCRVNKGTSKWYFDEGHTQRMNDFVTISKYSTALVDDPDFENSKAYYTRCIFPDGKYCDKKVVVNPSMRSNGRIGTTKEEQSTEETESDCQFSKQRAAEILLSSLLCDKLSVLKGDERQILQLVKDALSKQGVELATITAAMVADMAAGDCYKVIEALTANITGAESVSDLNENLVNQKNIDKLFSEIVDEVLAEPADECTPPPFDLEESSFAGGRVSANVIDYNRYFIAPDGRAVKLPEGAQPKFYNFGYRWGAPPKGSLQGFVLANGEQYFADITNSPNKFNGYIQVKDPVCDPKVHYNGNLYETPAAGSPVYYLEPYNTNGDCGYNWIEANYTFSPTSDGSLKQIVPIPTGSFTNMTRFTGCVEESDWVTGADGIRRKTITDAGSKFSLEDRNGDITVKGQWKSFGKCPECAQVAEEALQRAITKARQKNGKITEKTNVVDGIEMLYGPAGMVKYTDMKIGDIIKNMAETYNSLLEKAKLPAEVWEPGKRFYVRDETAVISGAIEQALEELKETSDLVGLGLTLVSDPEGAYEQLKSFGQQMSWEKAKSIGVEVAKGAVFADEFEKGGKYALHGTGRAGVVIAKTIVTGGAGLLAVLKDAPNQLRKKLDDIAALLARLLSKLKDATLADVLEKDLANDDLYKILDADDDLVKSWEVLQKGGKTELKLTKVALEKVKDLLGDAKVQKALGTNYADELAAICKAQGGFSGAKSLVAHLEDVKAFCNKFDDKEGFDQVVASMKNSNGNVQDGLQHVLTQVNEADFDAGKVSKFDMEFEGEGLPCIKCKFDVQLTDGNKPKLIEYKSYLDASRIQLPQFLNYIASINDLSEMKYVFNAAKLSTEQAKEGMKTFMKTNVEDIFNIGFSKGLFKGIVLKDGTKIDIGTWQQLKGLCDNPEFSKSTLFDFITSN